jgi:hypothetical protein
MAKDPGPAALETATTPAAAAAPLVVVRNRIRVELDRATNAALGDALVGYHADRIRDLADAYVALGGDLELAPPPVDPRRATLEEVARAGAAVIAACQDAELRRESFAGRLDVLPEPLNALGEAIAALELVGGPA